MSEYDEIPYGGVAAPLSHPARLALAARFQGVAAADPRACRVLELGCAEGANLLPMAFHLEGSELVGVDASAAHIARAEEARDRLGLDNLSFVHADLREVELEGEFDYVIAHGVLSWVAEDVRARILALAQRHLTPNGALFLSYNCAAGWASKAPLRRVLLSRAAGAPPAERASRVREVLAHVAGSPLRESSPHAAALAAQAASALQHRNAYLVHEYLSEHHHAFDQRELRALAEAHGLAFLTELAPASNVAGLEDDLLGTLAPRFGEDADDLADVLLGRAFRSSVFVREGVERERSLDRALEGVVFRGRLAPSDSRFSLEPDVAETFRTASGAQISVRSAPLKAALVEIGRAWPRGLDLAGLLSRATLQLQVRRALAPEAQLDDAARAGLVTDLLELGRLGHLELRLGDPDVAREPPEAPRVSALTRLEAERDGYVTSPHHEVVPLAPFARELVRALDGSRDREALTARLREAVEAGGLAAEGPGGEPLSTEALAEALPALVERTIAELTAAGLILPG